MCLQGNTCIATCVTDGYRHVYIKQCIKVCVQCKDDLASLIDDSMHALCQTTILEITLLNVNTLYNNGTS